MKIDGHYDERADIACLRFEDYDPATVIPEEGTFGLRELDPADRHVVGLEFWRASHNLPADLLRMLPAPPIGVARSSPPSALLNASAALHLFHLDPAAVRPQRHETPFRSCLHKRSDTPHSSLASSGWVQDAGETVAASDADGGVGVKELAVMARKPDGSMQSVSSAVNSCPGNRHGWCPPSWSAPVVYSTQALPEGDNALSVTAKDGWANQSDSSAWHVKVDRGNPTVGLSGALAEPVWAG